VRGDTTVVDACDFADLLASSDELAGAALPPQSLQDLDDRRRELDDSCEGVGAD
jgi:hypothetical protein